MTLKYNQSIPHTACNYCDHYTFLLCNVHCLFLPRGEYIGIYALFGIGQIGFMIVASFSLATGGIFASKLIHKQLLMNVLRLPMSFFETTPSGRILNRFAKDINTIDEAIPRTVWSFLKTMFSVLSTIFVVSYATPLFMVVILPMAVLYFSIQVR